MHSSKQFRGPAEHGQCPAGVSSRAVEARLPMRPPARVHGCPSPCAGIIEDLMLDLMLLAGPATDVSTFTVPGGLVEAGGQGQGAAPSQCDQATERRPEAGRNAAMAPLPSAVPRQHVVRPSRIGPGRTALSSTDSKAPGPAQSSSSFARGRRRHRGVLRRPPIIPCGALTLRRPWAGSASSA